MTIEFPAYQARWLADQARLKLWVASRRIGKTFAVSLEEACRAAGIAGIGTDATTYDPKAGVDQHVISASEDQAVAHVAEVGVHLDALSGLVGVRLVDGSPTRTRIALRNGRSVLAFAANPRTIRGSGGDVTIDEAGAVPFASKVWASAKPIADATLKDPRGYRVRLVGTPLGDDNLFSQLALTDAGAQWSRHWTTIHDAIADGFPADAAQLRAELGDDEAFGQEYLCEFLSSSSRYLREDVLDACTYHAAELPDFGEPRVSWAGLDVARRHDLSALVEVVSGSGGSTEELWSLAPDVRRGLAWAAQANWIAPVAQRVHKLAIDATGVGQAFAEALEATHGSKIEQVVFTMPSKEGLVTGLRLALEQKRLRIPADSELRRDLLSIRKRILPSGNTVFDAERTVTGSHADRAWALALAVHAAGSGASRGPVYTSVRRRVTAGLNKYF